MKIFVLSILFIVNTVFAQNISSVNSSTTNTVEIEENFDEEFASEFKTTKSDSDPFEGYNRVMTSFNDSFYMNILIPVSDGYSNVVSKDIRTGVGNMFENIFFPIRFINNILQLKFDNAIEETGRFLVNSTVGLLGYFDVAKDHLGWEAHNEDFGQTLGYYGVGPGPHIVLPILGPSNLRDAFSKVPDYMLDPTSAYVFEYPNEIPSGWIEKNTIKGYYWVNKASLNKGFYESMRKDAVDLYPVLKTFYEQHRKNEIAK